MDTKLSETREKEIFRELVNHRELGRGRDGAQVAMAQRHGVSLDTVKFIERKGMARDWPPLD
jgi:hypothetical protein